MSAAVPGDRSCLRQQGQRVIPAAFRRGDIGQAHEVRGDARHEPEFPAQLHRFLQPRTRGIQPAGPVLGDAQVPQRIGHRPLVAGRPASSQDRFSTGTAVSLSPRTTWWKQPAQNSASPSPRSLPSPRYSSVARSDKHQFARVRGELVRGLVGLREESHVHHLAASNGKIGLNPVQFPVGGRQHAGIAAVDDAVTKQSGLADSIFRAHRRLRPPDLAAPASYAARAVPLPEGPLRHNAWMPRPPRGPFRDMPREVAVLAAVSFTVALGFGIVAPDIAAFARHFGVSTAAAASVVSAFALLRVAGALPAGRLVDRLGEHTVMAAGIAIVAVSSILAGFSGSFAQLIVLRGIGGLGSAMFSVSAQTLLLGSVPGHLRGRASGLFSGGFLIGGISGPALGGIIAAWSLRAPFFIYGGLLVIPSVIAAVMLRDARGRPAARVARAARPFGEIARTLRSRAYRAAAAANLADGFAAVGVRSAIVPLYVHDVLHRSAVWTGLGFLLVAALNAAALLPAGRAADRIGRKPVIVAGCLASAAGMAMLALLPGVGGYLTGLTVLGLGSGLLDVAPAAMIGDILGGQGGTVVATFQMAGDAGTVAGPVAAGYLVDTVSYGAAFGLAAGILSLAAAAGLFAPETRSQQQAIPPAAGA